jgi:hypothetical protein
VGSTQTNLKIYGSAVWNHWLDHAFGGDDVIQDAWSQSANLPTGFTDSFAPDAYRKSIVDHGGTGFVDQFEDFAVATSEWRAPGNAFPDVYPDIPRAASLTVNAAGVQRTLDHTTFQLLNVAPPGTAQSYTLSATVDAGISSAIALVGRTGNSNTAGTVVSQITRLPSGGSGSVTLPAANLYGRITAVLVNADVDQNGFAAGDWKFTGDNSHFASVTVTSAPTVTTTAATNVTMTGATLNGTVNPNGQSTTYQFEYGTDTSYGTSVPAGPRPARPGQPADHGRAPWRDSEAVRL